ncbi:MFS transporter [candidate division KSB1 bacterium]|nr:MFS transporter [candidate division KSB1 bacterium]
MKTGRVNLLAMGHFINDSYQGFITPLLPLLMTKLDFGLALAGLVTSIASVSTSLIQPLFGHLADRSTAPYFVVVGPLVTALFLGSIGWVDSYGMLIIIVVVAGLGTAAFHPQAAALVGGFSEKRRGLGMSMFVTGGSAGHSIGPLIIIPIVTTLGLEYSFITIIPGVLISILLFKFVPVTVTADLELTLERIKPRRHSLLLLLLTIVILRSFIIVGYSTYIPIYLNDNGISLLLAGAALTVFELSGAIGAIIGGPLSDKMGVKSVILWSLILALPLLWFFLQSTGIIALVFLGVAGFMLFSAIPVSIILAQHFFPRQKSTVSSLMMGFAWGIGGVLVTPLGILAEKTNLETALLVLTGVGVIAIVAALFLPNRY